MKADRSKPDPNEHRDPEEIRRSLEDIYIEKSKLLDSLSAFQLALIAAALRTGDPENLDREEMIRNAELLLLAAERAKENRALRARIARDNLKYQEDQDEWDVKLLMDVLRDKFNMKAGEPQRRFMRFLLQREGFVPEDKVIDYLLGSPRALGDPHWEISYLRRVKDRFVEVSKAEKSKKANEAKRRRKAESASTAKENSPSEESDSEMA